MKVSTRILSTSLGLGFIFTILGCLGGSGSTPFALNGNAKEIQLSVSNFSTIPALWSSLTLEGTSPQVTSVNQAVGTTQCPAKYFGDKKNPVTFKISTLSTDLGTVSNTMDDDSGVYSYLVYGTAATPKAQLINSSELPGPYRLFVADLSTTNSSSFDLFIIDTVASTSDQTTPVKGSDGLRVTPYNITKPSTYRVELRSQTSGLVFASATVVIDALHKNNVVAFTDSTTTGFDPHVIHDVEGCSQ